MMQQGSWAVLGMEIECVLLRLLLSVPSIAFDQRHKPFLVFWGTSDEVTPQSQEETDQEQPMLTNTPNSWQITTKVYVEGVCRHLWLHYPSTSASSFLNYYNSFQLSTPTPSEKYEQLDVDFKESGSHSLLVIMASKKYASFNFGKEIFCCGK